MSEEAPFALTPLVYACVDGPELLVYAAGSGQPLWQVMLSSPITGVGGSGERVFAVDADGRLREMNALDGNVLEETDLPGAVRGLVVEQASGSWAALLDGKVVVRPAGGAEREIPFDGVQQVALGPKGASLGMGSRTGAFYAVDTASGVAWGTVELGAELDAIAWCNLGFWLVAAGPALHKVAPDGRSILGATPLTGRVTALAVSPDGMLAAWSLDDRAVVVSELKGGERLGAVMFRARQVGGVCFAEPGVLGIGLDDGDANRLDLLSNTLTRTGQHRGRAFAQWAVKLDLEPGRVRGALVRAQAGTSEIASRVSQDPDVEYGPDGQPKKKQSCLMYVLTTAAVTLALMFVCTGLLAVGYAVWHKLYYG